MTVWHTIGGHVTVTTRDQDDARRLIPVKNIAGVRVLTHDPQTGEPRYVTPDYLTIEDNNDT